MVHIETGRTADGGVKIVEGTVGAGSAHATSATQRLLLGAAHVGDAGTDIAGRSTLLSQGLETLLVLGLEDLWRLQRQ